MMKRFWIISVLILACFSSCKQEDLRLYDGDYLIFGHFYGMCGGEGCVEKFKLESNRLLEDTTQRLGDYYNFESGYQNVPPYLHGFMDQVNETIRSVNGW